MLVRRAEEHHRQLRLLGAWQAEKEGRASAQFALYPDAPAMRLHDGAADVEAKARARRPPTRRIVELLEALEDTLLLAERDALPGVGDADDHFIVGHLAAHADIQPPLRILDRVIQQIEQHLLDAPTIRIDQRYLCRERSEEHT